MLHSKFTTEYPGDGYPERKEELKGIVKSYFNTQENQRHSIGLSDSADVPELPTRTRRRAARRRYADLPSSDEDNKFDEGVDITRLTPEAQRRVKR